MSVKAIDSIDFMKLFELMHPGFFDKPYIRELPDSEVFDEMILPLGAPDGQSYEKTLDSSITFGFFTGDIAELKNAVAQVDKDWADIFDGSQRVYCGFVGGKTASFCIIDDMGEYDSEIGRIKVGGPGCVGTLPEYRNKGIALTMIKRAGTILKNEGFDISWIHQTGVARWYEKLGYRVVLRWNRNGII